MGFLSGSRSKFPNNIDEIKELYDLSPSLKQDAIRYQELIGKNSLSTSERDELQQLTVKLSDYIITAEDRNYFGDVIIKTQKFFKENVQDFIAQKQQEITRAFTSNKNSFVSFVTEKTNEIKEFINSKKTEIQGEIDKFKDLGLWSNTKQYYTKNMVHYEGNTYLAKKDNIGTTPVITDNDTWQLMTIKGDTGYSVNLQPRGDFNISTNYQKHDIVNYKGNLYYSKKETNGIYPTNEDNWSLFLTGNGEILTNLQTENKLSLVGAINEVFVKTKQTAKDLVDKYYNKTELNGKFNDMYSAMTQGLDVKLGKNEKAKDSEKLGGLEPTKYTRSFGFLDRYIPKEIFNNPIYPQSYTGTINYGTEVGLPCANANVSHTAPIFDGDSSQIAIPFDNNKTYGIYYRVMTNNSTWKSWEFANNNGAWNQEVRHDAKQVIEYMRWKNYGQNHVIFDASKSVRPDGQACNNTNSQDIWKPTFPTLMGFNGSATYGVRVDSSRTADLVKGRDLATELDSLKQSAVDGKQTIINGINTAVGSNSGLTINNSWGDLNWWIVNKTLSGSSIKVNIYVNGSEANNTLNNNPNRIFYKPVQYLGTDGQYGWRTVHVFRFPLANLFDMTTPILCIIGNYELYSHIINFKNSIGKTIERNTYSFFRGDNSYNVNGHKLVVTGSYMDISMTCNIVNSDYGTDEIGKCLSAVKLTFIGS